MAVVKEQSKTFPLWFQDGTKNANYASEYGRCLANMPIATNDNNVANPFDALPVLSGKNLSGTLAPNGKIYCAPFNSDFILVIDTSNNSTYTFGSGLGGTLWSTGVLADNGKIYCPPFAGDSVLVIDTNSDTYYEILEGSFAIGTATDIWAGGSKASNGKIYFAPYRNVSILVIDPTAETFTTIAAPELNADANFFSTCLGLDGKIYCIPFSYTQIMVIDPATDTKSYLPTVYSGSGKWLGASLAKNGAVYCTNLNSSQSLKINTLTQATSLVAYTFTIGSNRGAATDAEGNVWFSPFSSPFFYKIDSLTDTVFSYPISPLSDASYATLVLAQNGKMYSIPFDSTTIRVIGQDVELDKNFPLSKFNTGY